MNDITKHPIMDARCKCSLPMKGHGHDCHTLYHPHHGDMTGWRYINVGEVRAVWDEAIGQQDSGLWLAASIGDVPETYGDEASGRYDLAYRRRLAPALDASKPSDQKRFVTVVYHATEENLEWIKMSVKPFEVREGNYLEKFDNRKERVLKALEGEE